MITLTQLEYIVAIDEYRHFATAAEKCFVTQPTLSMQIKKLELLGLCNALFKGQLILID